MNRTRKTCRTPSNGPRCALWASQKEKRERQGLEDYLRLFEEIVTENVPNLREDVDIQIQDVQ